MNALHNNARRLACVLAATAALPAAAATPGSTYPDRPIRLIVGFAPGGAVDLVSRTLGQQLTERWGQQVIVDNRTGAGGVIAMQIAGKAPPDGYTLLLGSSSQFSFGPALQPDQPYDPVRGYTPIAQVAISPIVITVHPSLPARSVRDLIQLAKGKPGQLTYGSPGAGSGPHLAGVLFARAAAIDIVHVPYKGGAEAIVALMGGHIQISFGAISTAWPQVKGGKLRALAVTEAKRLSGAPDIPTVAESGLPEFGVSQWYGIFGPAGTAAALTSKLSAELAAILALPDVRERLAGQGLEIAYLAPAAFSAHVKADQAKWMRLLKEAGLQGRQAP